MPQLPSNATDSSPADAAARPSWAESLRVYREPASLRMLALGFSAGLPLLLVLGTLSFRLREAGIDRATIGYLSWVGLAYGFKWMWAPLVDRMPLPPFTHWLGRRRGWLLAAQLGIMGGLVGMALQDPKLSLDAVILFSLLVAFCSATQDIALDAYRIESADITRQGAIAAMYQAGYRTAMIWAGAGVLWIAGHEDGASTAYQHGSWQLAYLIMAASMGVGVLTVLLSPEPARRELPPARHLAQWLREARVSPFADFLTRYRWHAALLLALISVYRISDVVMGIMANPFFVDMGYSKQEVAAVSKVYGVIMTLVGAFIGGVLGLRLGVMRVLLLGAVLSAATNLLYAWLSAHGRDLTALIWIISADNLASGIASAAFIAYLSGLTNVSYSATQYAMFTSLMLLLPKFVAGFSGAFVNQFGYAPFFVGTALLGIPVVLLVWLAMKYAPSR